MKKEKNVFIKRINEEFYEVYNEDAYVIANLMKYKLVLEHNDFVKTGFPEMSLEKVMDMLKINKVSFTISDDEDLSIDFQEQNQYDKFLNDAIPVERVYGFPKPKYYGNFVVLFEGEEEPESYTIGENINCEAELVDKVYKNEVDKVISLDSGIAFKILEKNVECK